MERADGGDGAGMDFAAKVRWRMAHDRRPILVTLQDKFAVRAYARERGVAMAELLQATENASTLAFDRLPRDCFIKASHGSGWNFLRRGGRIFHFVQGHGDGGAELPELSRRECVRLCRKLLAQTYSRQEWAYLHIPPRILVEEMLWPAEGDELLDYRFYTFDGVVKAISLGSPSYRLHRENVFLTPEWRVIGLTRYREGLPDPIPGRPEDLGDMVRMAERLGQGIDFVRVDLYRTAKGIRLGEMTLYPEAGAPGTPTSCPRFNGWLGGHWRVPGGFQSGAGAPMPLSAARSLLGRLLAKARGQ